MCDMLWAVHKDDGYFNFFRQNYTIMLDSFVYSILKNILTLDNYYR
jgi:hypothetical protein